MLIEGVMSVSVAIACYFFLPNWANNTPWLTPEESEMAQYRLVLSAGGHDEATSDLTIWQGAKLASKDLVSDTFLDVAAHLSRGRQDAARSFLLTYSSLGSSCYYISS